MQGHRHKPRHVVFGWCSDLVGSFPSQMVLDTTSFWLPFQVPDQFVFLKSWPSIFLCRVSKFQLLRLRFVVRCTEFWNSIRSLIGLWKNISKEVDTEKTCKPCYLRNSTGDSNSQLSSDQNSWNAMESKSKQLIINNHRCVCLSVYLFVCRCKKTQDAHWTCQSDGYHISPNPLPILIKYLPSFWKGSSIFTGKPYKKSHPQNPPPPFREESQQPNRGSAPLHQWHRGEKGRDSPEAFKPISTRERWEEVGGALKNNFGNGLFHLLIKWIYMVS